MHCANGYTVKKMSDQPYPHLNIKSLAWKFLSTMRKIPCFIISLQVLKNKCEDLVLPASSWSSEVTEHPSREDTWAQEKESGVVFWDFPASMPHKAFKWLWTSMSSSERARICISLLGTIIISQLVAKLRNFKLDILAFIIVHIGQSSTPDPSPGITSRLKYHGSLLT